MLPIHYFTHPMLTSGKNHPLTDTIPFFDKVVFIQFISFKIKFQFKSNPWTTSPGPHFLPGSSTQCRGKKGETKNGKKTLPAHRQIDDGIKVFPGPLIFLFTMLIDIDRKRTSERNSIHFPSDSSPKQTQFFKRSVTDFTALCHSWSREKRRQSETSPG